MEFNEMILEFKEDCDTRWLEKELESKFPIDIAYGLSECEDEDIILFCKHIDIELLYQVIKEAPTDIQVKIIKLLDKKKILGIFYNVPDDDVVDILGELPFNQRKELLKSMKDSEIENFERLLKYQKDSAGGIMTTDYIALKGKITAKYAINKIKQIAPETEVIEILFIINDLNQLIGTVNLRDVLIANEDTQLEEIMNTNVISVLPETDQEEVSLLVSKYNVNAIPVINRKQALIGIITIDDIIDVIQEEHTEDILKMAGVDKDETVDGSIIFSIKKRLPWLCVNLLTATLAAGVVGVFEATISEIVALAVIMPIIAGMGGNAGNQTLSIIIRNIALNEIDVREDWKLVFKELAVGSINGLSIGILASTVILLITNNYYLSLITLIAMVLNLMIAGIFGFLIPVTLKQLKLDPALSSSIFLTTVTDVLGFFIFLGLATVFKDLII